MLQQGFHIVARLPVIAQAQSYTSAEGDLTDASLKKLVLFNLGSGAKSVYHRFF
tara:strand:- start:38 stop:199 length:162 start_codon:yes stop_codon:yes gene_type:complete